MSKLPKDWSNIKYSPHKSFEEQKRDEAQLLLKDRSQGGGWRIAVLFIALAVIVGGGLMFLYGMFSR